MTLQAAINEIVPHAAGSDTSRESAIEFISSQRAGEAGIAVYKIIEDRGAHGATCFEIERLLGMLHQTASGRIWVLRHKLGVIYDSGERRLNVSTNRHAAVLKATRLLDGGVDTAISIDRKCGCEAGKSGKESETMIEAT